MKEKGISFLLLLGIAMPLKYFADMPGQTFQILTGDLIVRGGGVITHESNPLPRFTNKSSV